MKRGLARRYGRDQTLSVIVPAPWGAREGLT